MSDDHNGPEQTFRDTERNLRDRIEALQAREAALRAENATLAAGSCDVPGGKVGDEHGHFYCTLERELAAAKHPVAAAVINGDPWCYAATPALALCIAALRTREADRD